MRQWFPVIVTLGLAAVAVPLFAQERPATVTPVGELHVGVVDLAVVFKQYKKSAELQKKIDEEVKRLERELDDQKKLIENLRKMLEDLEPMSETYRIKEDEKDAAVAHFDRFKQRIKEAALRRGEEYNFQILADIEAVVRSYGDDHHFMLIFNKIDARSGEEVRRLAGVKPVLYCHKNLDITDAIVEILNKNYDAAQKTAGPGTGTPGPAPAPPPQPVPPPQAPGKR